MKKITYIAILFFISIIFLNFGINTKGNKKLETKKIVKDVNKMNEMKAILRVGNKSYNVKFYNINAAKEFYNMLPLKLTLTDYANSEKITSTTNTSQKFNLDTSDVKLNDVGKIGNISFYKPWGNLAFFYKNGPEGFSGLVNIGEIGEGGEWLEEFKNDFEVVIEKSEK